jgi:hypothetical protein
MLPQNPYSSVHEKEVAMLVSMLHQPVSIVLFAMRFATLACQSPKTYNEHPL